MKHKKTFLKTMATIMAVLTVMYLTTTANYGEENPGSGKPGLLILTHGSPSPQWNTAVNELVDHVRAANATKGTFAAIEGANLEFAKPDAAEGIEKLEKAGCDRVIVVPAFIFPTSHSHFDVPAVLGLYSSPSIRETLRQEKARIARPNIPITVTQTLSEGELLEQYVLDEAASLSKEPEREVLLLIAHGDEGHEGLIDPVMWELVTKCCGKLQLSQGLRAYCEVGQSYHSQVAPIVKRYTEEGKRVLLVGLYLATSAERIDKIAEAGMKSAGTTFDKKEVALSKRGVIKHSRTPEFILKIAEEAL